MKTKEELNALKDEVTTLREKLQGLTEDELMQVTGGKYEDIFGTPDPQENPKQYEFHIYHT